MRHLETFYQEHYGRAEADAAEHHRDRRLQNQDDPLRIKQQQPPIRSVVVLQRKQMHLQKGQPSRYRNFQMRTRYESHCLVNCNVIVFLLIGIAVQPGGECESDFECTAVLENGKCIDRKCGCPSEYYMMDREQSNLKTICMKSKRAGDSCVKNTDCLRKPDEEGFMQCDGGICKCAPEHPYCEIS